MGNFPKIALLSTGDEVLYGQIIDTNAPWLADFLFNHGFMITARFTVGDNLVQLVTMFQQLSLEYDILIVNGGLGPTSDDLTAEAAAQANHEPVVLHQQWLTVMQDYFSGRGKVMPQANVKQAMLPQSATIIDNPVGTACGFAMMINQCRLFFTPGVPSEFKVMITDQILPAITQQWPVVIQPICYRLTTMGRSESDLADEIASQLTIPAAISVGYRSAMPIIELKLTGTEAEKPQMDRLWPRLKELVADNLLYEGTLGLAGLVSQLLTEQSQSLVIVEEQTAGLIAWQLYAADAPLLKSLVVQQSTPCLKQLAGQYPHALMVSLGQFSADSRQFTLELTTSKQYYCYRLNYTGRLYDRATMQQILAAVVLDTLRRYLSDLPLMGKNSWLEIVSAKQLCIS